MITQVNQFISTIVAELRTTTFVQNKIAEGSWKAGSPYYWYGTPMEINNTLNNIRDGRNKFPAVFLFEPFSVVENEDMMQNGAFSIMKWDYVLKKQSVSTHCGVVVCQMTDVHFEEEAKEAEKKIIDDGSILYS